MISSSGKTQAKFFSFMDLLENKKPFSRFPNTKLLTGSFINIPTKAANEIVKGRKRTCI